MENPEQPGTACNGVALRGLLRRRATTVARYTTWTGARRFRPTSARASSCRWTRSDHWTTVDDRVRKPKRARPSMTRRWPCDPLDGVALAYRHDPKTKKTRRRLRRLCSPQRGEREGGWGCLGAPRTAGTMLLRQKTKGATPRNAPGQVTPTWDARRREARRLGKAKPRKRARPRRPSGMSKHRYWASTSTRKARPSRESARSAAVSASCEGYYLQRLTKTPSPCLYYGGTTAPRRSRWSCTAAMSKPGWKLRPRRLLHVRAAPTSTPCSGILNEGTSPRGNR